MSGDVEAGLPASARRTRKSRRKERERLSEAQTALGWGILLALFGLLGAIYLYQTSEIAGIGRHVQRLQIDLTAIKRANGELEREITESQSLDRLRTEAAGLGFVQAGPDDLEYLIIKEYPAASESETVSFLEPTPTPAGSMKEALWLAFAGRVGDLIHGESRGVGP